MKAKHNIILKKVIDRGSSSESSVQWLRQSNHLYHLLVRTSGGPAGCRSSIPISRFLVPGLDPRSSSRSVGLVFLVFWSSEPLAQCEVQERTGRPRAKDGTVRWLWMWSAIIFFFIIITFFFLWHCGVLRQDGGADAESVETFARHLQIPLILLSFGGFFGGALETRLRRRHGSRNFK